MLEDIFSRPKDFAIHENENIRKDGKRLWMLWKNKIVYDHSGRRLYIQSIASDITLQRRREGQLRLQSQLLEAIQKAVIATDLDGKITYINKFAEQLYGWGREEAMGLDIINVTVPQTSREQAGEIMDALSRGGSWAGEFTVQNRSGREFTAHVTNSPVLDEEGRLIGIIGVSHEVKQEGPTEAM
jgi:PAS domain S-box-containing protein